MYEHEACILIASRRIDLTEVQLRLQGVVVCRCAFKLLALLALSAQEEHAVVVARYCKARQVVHHPALEP